MQYVKYLTSFSYFPTDFTTLQVSEITAKHEKRVKHKYCTRLMRKCGRDEVAYPEPGKTSNIEFFAKVNSE